MHELVICQALIEQVITVARDNAARRVSAITLDVGPLSGVESDLLDNAFPIASAGTLAEGAELTICAAPVRVWCATCRQETEAQVNRLVCDLCGDWRTQLRSGDELLLRSVVLEDFASEQTARSPKEKAHV